jgi:hypothetical protein
MKTKTQKNEFSLNFGGFYESEHSQTIDNNIEIFGYDWQKIDYKKTYVNYCKAYLNKLSEELKIELSFISLDSPKYYNFTTDKIFCSVSDEDFKTLLNEYDTKELFNYIEEHSKSRDGFTSFYSGYKAVREDKEIFLQYLFDYILQYEEIDFYDLEFEIQEIEDIPGFEGTLKQLNNLNINK